VALSHANISIPLLRVPPFPGSRPASFSRAGIVPKSLADLDVDTLLQAIRSNRVGGTYWGSQPRLPAAPYTLVRIRDCEAPARRLPSLDIEGQVVVWLDSPAAMPASSSTTTVSGTCDPWHLLSGASRVFVDSDDELALIAAIAGVPIESSGSGRFASLSGKPTDAVIRQAFEHQVVGVCSYFDPYSGEPIDLAKAIECCAFWRRLIDSNRNIDAAAGFAFWKRTTVAPLLWGGSESVPFVSNADAVGKADCVAVWRARAPSRLLSELERREVQLIEVEDGFIRSLGLGSDCVPPLSIVVDRLGAHFDPKRPSELEELLEGGDFSSEVLDRARCLRELIVASGLSKYSTGHKPLERRVADRRYILVPGQVEDDRAVVSGGAGLTSNLELIRRVRAEAPDAYLIYKPHPDVEAGHRTGAIADEPCLSLADEIMRNEPISALLNLVDEVHVNSSLAGFEALLRNKPVTTHGIPFYAGWGLTRDLAPAPVRRTAKRTLDELVAAVLLRYPRYLDPLTGLPCPPEVLVERLTNSAAGVSPDGIVVRLRRLQGRCRRGLAALRHLR